MKSVRAICMLGLLLACCGCGRFRTHPFAAPAPSDAPPRISVSPHAADLKPRRIVIVTTQDFQDRLKEQAAFAQGLAAHLRSLGSFDAVVSRETVCIEQLPMRAGYFDERQLVELAYQYGADAVLYCHVTDISAYEPLRLQTELLLVHTGEAIAIVSATSSFDLKYESTRKQYLDYLARTTVAGTPGGDVLAPSQLIDFSANQVAWQVLSVWGN